MFCFLDLETTGLDPAKHSILEIACRLKDSAYQTLPIEPFEVTLAWRSWFDFIDPEAKSMHTKSGLLEACHKSDITVPEAEILLHHWLREAIRKYDAGRPLHLAGNSVHFDRRFLRAKMPRVEALFHHRHLDVSSFRIMGELFRGPPLGGDKPHRALADVDRSIKELDHWISVIRSTASEIK